MTQNTMQRVAEYIAVGQQGDRAAARAGLEQLWEECIDGDPVTKCGIAHSLADVQEAPQAELVWDLRALTSALDASNDDAAGLGMSHGIAGLMPSLHLNLADVYRRLRQSHVARGHALEAQAALGAVEPNPYFQTIAEALDRLLGRLEQGNFE